MDYYFKEIDSPVGKIKLVASDQGLSAILWEKDDPKRVPIRESIEKKNHPILLETENQLGEYFSGQRKTFSIPLDFVGTDFQKNVWQALLTIPYGEIRTYGQLAEQIGNPKSVRAVGAANGKNPIAILAPCHRVIGASGSLTGFAGGLANKAFLLNLESGRTGHKLYNSTPASQQLTIFH
jgi:methylated-DNA-[protein]-cysteine S-methyltransferase